MLIQILKVCDYYEASNELHKGDIGEAMIVGKKCIGITINNIEYMFCPYDIYMPTNMTLEEYAKRIIKE